MKGNDFDLDNTYKLTFEEFVIPPNEQHAKAERLSPDSARATASLMSDPITGRFICRDCWNCLHGTKKEPGCKAHGCDCGCKDIREEHRRERSAHAAARWERKALEREQLEEEDNPLRAFNPSYREPAKNAKGNRRSSRKHKQPRIQYPPFPEENPEANCAEAAPFALGLTQTTGPKR